MADDTTQAPMVNSPTDITHYREQYTFYARKLLQDLGLGDVPQPERGELLAAIEANIQQVLTNVLLENVSDQHMAAAEHILEDGGNTEDVVIYLATHIENVDIKIADAIASTYAQLLSESQQLAEKIGMNQSTPQVAAVPDEDTTSSEPLSEADNSPVIDPLANE